MKNCILALLLVLFLGACSYAQKDVDGNIVAPNFQDGTWSSCTYTSPKGRVLTPPPVQLGGAPLAWMEPDGTSIDCKLIPKV